jgi:hypothetical protein
VSDAKPTEKALLDAIRGDEAKIDAPILRALVAIAVEVDRANVSLEQVKAEQRATNNRMLGVGAAILLAVLSAIIQQAIVN